MKTIAIVGSPRPNGNTSYLVDRVLEEIAKVGIETEKIMLSKYRINPCLGHKDCATYSECTQKDDAPAILEKFRTADGIIVASPVYYYNMTAQMKAFVDRNFFLYTHNIPVQARCAGVVVVAGSEGLDTAVRAMQRFVKVATEVPESKIFTVSGFAEHPGDASKDAALVGEAQKLGRQIAQVLLS